MPFFEGYKVHEWTKKEIQGNYFHESTLVSSLQSKIHIMIEFPLIFSETYFVEVPKIHKNCSPQEKTLYIIASPSLFMCIYSSFLIHFINYFKYLCIVSSSWHWREKYWWAKQTPIPCTTHPMHTLYISL